MKAMTRAISLVGLGPLAKMVGVSYQALRKFERTLVPGERVIPIARATAWRVTPHQLRPDLYPNATDGIPPGVSVGQSAAGLCAQGGHVVAQLADAGLQSGGGESGAEQGVEFVEKRHGERRRMNRDHVEQQQHDDLQRAGGIAKQGGAGRNGCSSLGHIGAHAVVVG